MKEGNITIAEWAHNIFYYTCERIKIIPLFIPARAVREQLVQTYLGEPSHTELVNQLNMTVHQLTFSREMPKIKDGVVCKVRVKFEGGNQRGVIECQDKMQM